jgi:hypothetical protein
MEENNFLYIFEMILNGYIIYKQNLSAGCNTISRLDYTIKIVDALSKELEY